MARLLEIAPGDSSLAELVLLEDLIYRRVWRPEQGVLNSDRYDRECVEFQMRKQNRQLTKSRSLSYDDDVRSSCTAMPDCNWLPATAARR
ncbi:hypothetical protein RCH21_002632 [Arthrobacter sp. PL16]|nr:hypothetical protein [Arthrobacter sp. PL16]